ncbi:CPBP family intramembrane glutamic endopeptidase [Micromonospora echinofusca]|uniref:CPBP family intramembrane metalloprotease n=1 Tax=Micromonospora echinofusca TaxID=47858 RepID=A0ABS3VZ23_MICEH|nr:CPBP family intramembrane glutamic endopeptidase [Micromonospora echinofusca]MBO4209777.1 CPBP family intramembrane metalloprotease [Micromonospora echinofusca]
MFRQLPDSATALVYIVLVLAVSAGTANLFGGLILAISPLLVTLVMLLVVTREGWARAGWRRLGLGRLGLREWPFTVLATAGVSVLAAVAVVTIGLARFTTPTGPWLTDLLSLCATGPVLAYAEEVGWRGYLLPRLLGLGERVAMLVSGVVWTAWHLPYILFTPYYHNEGNTPLVLALFTGSVLAFSVLFGRLRIRTDSVWPAVLAHFAHNATFAWLTMYAVRTDHPVVVNEYLAGDTGLFVLLGTAVCGYALSRRARRAARRRPPAPGPAARASAAPTPDGS